MLKKFKSLLILTIIFVVAATFCYPAVAEEEKIALVPEYLIHSYKTVVEKDVPFDVAVIIINNNAANFLRFEGIDDDENLGYLGYSMQEKYDPRISFRKIQRDYYYVLKLKNIGTYSIKAIFDFNGEIESVPIEITVVERSMDDFSNSIPETKLSHKEAFLGEKIVVTDMLYSKIVFFTYATNRAWHSYRNAISKTYYTTDETKGQTEINGEAYYEYLAGQVIIEPLNMGYFEIKPGFFVLNKEEPPKERIEGDIQIMGETTKQYLGFDNKYILIKPLPAGKPSIFSGVVGEVELTGEYDKFETEYGQPIKLTVTASGFCNLDSLNKLVGANINGFMIYETITNFSEKVVNNRYFAEKTFEILFVPEKTGNLTIPEVKLSYFNPLTEQYEIVKIPSTPVTVSGDPALANLDVEEHYEKLLINQVNYSANNEKYFTLQIEKETIINILIVLSVAAVITICIIYVVYQGKHRDKILISIYKNIQSEQDINKIYNHFNSMIKHKFGVNIKSLSKEAVKQSIPENFSEKVTEIMDYMETNDEKSEKTLKQKIKIFYEKLKKSI